MRRRQRQARQEERVISSHGDAPLTLHTFSYAVDWPVEPLEQALLRSVGREIATSQVPCITVPVSLFSGSQPTLRALVRYLRERQGLSFSEMAALLGRAEPTLRATWRAARSAAEAAPDGSPLIIEPSPEMPVSLFGQLGLSPLETVVCFLLGMGLRNADVAAMLGLDPRTTSTVKRRIIMKGVMPA